MGKGGDGVGDCGGKMEIWVGEWVGETSEMKWEKMVMGLRKVGDEVGKDGYGVEKSRRWDKEKVGKGQEMGHGESREMGWVKVGDGLGQSRRLRGKSRIGWGKIGDWVGNVGRMVGTKSVRKSRRKGKTKKEGKDRRERENEEKVRCTMSKKII